MDLYIDYDAYGNSMPENKNKVSLPEGEASKNWYTISQLADIDLCFHDILETPVSLQSHSRLPRENPPQSDPKEAAGPEEQSSASGGQVLGDIYENDEDEEEEDPTNLFSHRLTNCQPNLPERTSFTPKPSAYRWRRSPIPSYHPSYMHNGYPPGAPTMPVSAPNPNPDPSPSLAPVTLNHDTQTGRFEGPVPRPSRRTSCIRHRKMHKICTCGPEGKIDLVKAARPKRKGPTKRGG